MSKDNKSSYYDAGGIETIQFIRAKLTPPQYQGYLLGNMLKYLSRYNWKGLTSEERFRDVEKAYVYLKLFMEECDESSRPGHN